MKIGIHQTSDSFSERWTTYCDANHIAWKSVNCYRDDIMDQLADCDALMWHFKQNSPKDNNFAKQLIHSVEASGRKVFPDTHTSWHFDDKVGQKYLLEGIHAPLPKTWVFYSKQEAMEWADQTHFPKVFKLRGGGGSQNVRLVTSRQMARRLIRKAFGRGFNSYYALGSLKERYRKYRLGKTGFFNVLVGVGRLFCPPAFAKVKGRDVGYIYFQEFIPGNRFDVRVVVIGDKAFAIKRMIREDDFRASGSGKLVYEKENFSEETIRLSFDMADKLNLQIGAFDFVFINNQIFILELSFGFVKEAYDFCAGYWDRSLNWHEGKFDFCGWMVEDLVNSIKNKQ